MRMPYIVGSWVRGPNHYGRERLIDRLLYGPDRAIWVVGTRRMGKTSLLRQLEWLTDHTDSEWVPLFWDMQGCRSSQDLSEELQFTLADAGERFARYGINVESFEGQDALVILRKLARTLNEQGKQLFVLIDEAEVLIDMVEQEAAWVGRLRRALQDTRVRTVIASTKLLAKLNDLTQAWMNSPFLSGFCLLNLTGLDDAAARALVRQEQTKDGVIAPDGVVDDVLIHTNGQPYLMQYLCQRLFASKGELGYLRGIEEDDLAADHILTGFFQNDFRHLTRTERRLLLAVAELSVAKESELAVALSDLPPRQIKVFLYGMERLGYLRTIFGQWAVGNEFLRRWVTDHFDELESELGSPIDEQAHQNMLEMGRRDEVRYLQEQIAHIESEIEQLEAELDRVDGDEQVDLFETIERLRRELARLRNQLAEISTPEEE